MGKSFEEEHFTFLNVCTVGVIFISPMLEAGLAKAVTKRSSMKYVICGVMLLTFRRPGG
jgi:hypothetical protein